MSTLTHLQRLEAESIDIMREAVSESEKPVMLYSIGKDSSVMLHLAMKAFYPSKPPFPLLHVVMLVYLYPFRLTPPKLVATDIAHAVPLTLIAGLGHLSLGNVDFTLLGPLLVGSIPGVIIGSGLSVKANHGYVRNAIAVMLAFVGGWILLGN
jgi:hypothetical protein